MAAALGAAVVQARPIRRLRSPSSSRRLRSRGCRARSAVQLVVIGLAAGGVLHGQACRTCLSRSGASVTSWRCPAVGGFIVGVNIAVAASGPDITGFGYRPLYAVLATPVRIPSSASRSAPRRWCSPSRSPARLCWRERSRRARPRPESYSRSARRRCSGSTSSSPAGGAVPPRRYPHRHRKQIWSGAVPSCSWRRFILEGVVPASGRDHRASVHRVGASMVGESAVDGIGPAQGRPDLGGAAPHAGRLRRHRRRPPRGAAATGWARRSRAHPRHDGIRKRDRSSLASPSEGLA